MLIAATADFKQLAVKGNFTAEELLVQWERIVQTNAKITGDYNYNSYFQLIKGYAQLLANYTIVKLSLWKLAHVFDWDYIEEVRKRGFKISLANNEAYATSLTAALHKVESFITRATMKRKELEAMQKDNHGRVSPVTFEEVIANLCAGLGFEVKDDITLARFNEYRKIIKQRHAAKLASYVRNK